MAWNIFDPRQQADILRIKRGNIAQRIAGGLGQFASGIGINRDFGISEMFGTPKAQTSNTRTYSTGAEPAIYPQKPTVPTNDNIYTNNNTAGGVAQNNVTTNPVYVPNINYYNGVGYDLNNQDDYRRLLEAQIADLESQNRTGLQDINRNLFQTTGYNDRANPISLDNIGADSTLGKQKKSFLDQIVENIEALADQEKSNMQNIGAYYSGLGDITQSSQAYRTGEEANKFQKARTKIDTQKTEGLSSLEKALSDFLYSDQSSRDQLARNFTTQRDTVLNQPASALSKVGDQINKLKVDYANAVYAGQDPTYIKEAIDSNTNIFNALNSLRQANIFRRIGTGSTANTEDILKYLNPQAV